MKFPQVRIAILILSMSGILAACGKAKYEASSAASPTNTVASSTISTVTSTSTTTSTTTSSSNLPLLQYSINQAGNEIYINGSLSGNQGNCAYNCSSSYTTAALSTDNVLKIKFRPAKGGNQVASYSELKVSISVNGTTLTPSYEDKGYTYGLNAELSKTMDFSNALSAGAATKITVNSPSSNWLCILPTYLNGAYAGGNNGVDDAWCYKSIYYSHKWAGTLYVQTSNTVDISTAGN